MDADFRKIKKLTDFMKKSGLLSLKIKDIELNLAPAAVFHVEPKNKDPIEEPKPEPQLTDEDLMFWSAPGYLPSENN